MLILEYRCQGPMVCNTGNAAWWDLVRLWNRRHVAFRIMIGELYPPDLTLCSRLSARIARTTIATPVTTVPMAAIICKIWYTTSNSDMPAMLMLLLVLVLLVLVLASHLGCMDSQRREENQWRPLSISIPTVLNFKSSLIHQNWSDMQKSPWIGL
jgi:hypothetical protein